MTVAEAFEQLKDLIGTWYPDPHIEEENGSCYISWQSAHEGNLETVEVEFAGERLSIRGTFLAHGFQAEDAWTLSPDGWEGYRKEVHLGGKRRIVKKLPLLPSYVEELGLDKAFPIKGVGG